MPNAWENRPYLVTVPFVGVAGMTVHDLPTRGKLSAIIFEVMWVSQMGGDNTLNPYDLMPLIEVIHRGSEVIKSLTGIQHAGIAWRRGGEQPQTWWMSQQGGVHRAQIVIPFGRYPYDREYGLTLDNLVNPQIRFLHDSNYAASGDAAGGYGVAVGTYTIRLIYAPEDTPFRGYIRTTRIDQYPIIANTWYYTEMPKNYKWPRIYVYSDCVDWNLMGQINALNLQADNRAWVPVSLDEYALQRLDTASWGRPELWRYFNHLNQANLPVLSVFDECWEAMCETQGGVGATCCNEAQGIFDRTLDHISSGVTVETKLIERGKGFGRMYGIPLCPPNQEAEIASQSLNSADWGRIMFELQTNGAVGTTPFVTIILEELVEGI